jgi:hypothetical protein
MKLFAVACIAAVAASNVGTTAQCATDFVEGCLSTADPSTCQTCVKNAPAGDCTTAEELALFGVCTKAPFTSSTEDCIKEVVVDCKSKFGNSKSCQECVLLHGPDLKNSNCSTVDIAGMEAICTQLNNTAV